MSIEWKMAWRNIWRNTRRSILTILAIAFACVLLVFMLSFQFGAYEDMIRFSLRIRTGHMQVQAEGYEENRAIRKVVENPEAVGAVLDEQQGVRAYTYRSNAFSLLSSKERTYGALVSGIVPERESGVTNIEEIIQKGEYLAEGDANQVLVGNLLADNLKVDVGDDVVVLGQARDGSVAASVLTVRGIFSSGMSGMDRGFALITRETFDGLYFMRGAAHEVVAMCDSLDAVGPVESAVQSAVDGMDNKHPLEVWNWNELIPGLLQGIKIDFFSGIIFYLILIIVVAFSILNTFLMAVFERTKEFGVLMALGTTSRRLTKLLLLESSFLCLVGMILGIAGGAVFTLFMEQHGIRIAGVEDVLREYGLPAVLRPRLSLATVLSGPAVVFVVTFLTALYPAFRVRMLKPVEALRSA
ncbi:MAG: ABC transporter permease [Desulfatibacillaceae bacterium]